MPVKTVIDRPKMGRAAELRTFMFWGWIKISPKTPKERHLQIEAHEMIHWEQHKRTYWFHALMYKFSKRYRQASEVEAYKAEIQASEDPKFIEQAAIWLSRDYNLGITVQEARELLI